jgi:hypothetical protein
MPSADDEQGVAVSMTGMAINTVHRGVNGDKTDKPIIQASRC